MCGISDQIAKHCNEPEERFCPECNGSMTFDKDGDLECDKDECEGMIILINDE